MKEQRKQSAMAALLTVTFLVGAPAPVRAVEPTTFYVAQSGVAAATPGDGTGCSNPDYVEPATGDDHAAIQEAITDAGAGDTIYLCAGSYDIGSTINLGTEAIFMRGAGRGNTILDGGYDTRILVSDANVNVTGLTFQHGYSITYGGAIVAPSANVNESSFVGNEADNDQGGGAILSWNVITVTNSSFVGNTAGTGGAIYTNSVAEVQNSRFTANTATSGQGGSIKASAATITNSNFAENTASGSGGAISAGTVTVSASGFTRNHAAEAGGAILADDVTVGGTTFTANSAGVTGGAILSDTALIKVGRFTENQANYGGAVHVYTTATVERSTFTRNVAFLYAGALLAPTAVLRFSEFSLNQAGSNAGAVFLYTVEPADLNQMRRNTFSKNIASRSGALNLERCDMAPSLAEGRRVERANTFTGNRATLLRRTANIELTVSSCGR